MTLFNRDPKGCTDLAELRQWVADLQEHYGIQHEINKVLREQNELMFRTCEKQGKENDLLTERDELRKQIVAGLKERIEEYETLFSVKSHNQPVRMN